MIICMWQAIQWPGLEHCAIAQTDKDTTVTSYLNGMVDKQPYVYQYEITINPEWKVSSFHIRSLTADTRQIKLVSDLQGHWFDGEGRHIDAFDDCLDIDISLTPFTNTLPVKRLQLAEGRRERIAALYILLPEFELHKTTQYYTRLEKRRYRYEQPAINFSAELPLDEHDTVTDYPGLWRRVH
jgi:hypothetical protein